jgi:hypothetical protein
VAQNHCVFLDLKRDKYSAVALEHAAPETALRDALARHRDALLGAGVLQTSAEGGRVALPDRHLGIEGHVRGVQDARAFGLAGDEARDLSITPWEIAVFFHACWRASRDLATKHVETIVERTRVDKARASDGARDIAKIARLTRVFARLRPWYPRNYLCLYDSLALIKFLRAFDIHPTWIFGVQAQPFGAHCWVQQDGLLLNEGSEYAGQFTHIMSV